MQPRQVRESLHGDGGAAVGARHGAAGCAGGEYEDRHNATKGLDRTCMGAGGRRPGDTEVPLSHEQTRTGEPVAGWTLQPWPFARSCRECPRGDFVPSSWEPSHLWSPVRGSGAANAVLLSLSERNSRPGHRATQRQRRSSGRRQAAGCELQPDGMIHSSPAQRESPAGRRGSGLPARVAGQSISEPSRDDYARDMSAGGPGCGTSGLHQTQLQLRPVNAQLDVVVARASPLGERRSSR
jgi:hypothetical protein